MSVTEKIKLRVQQHRNRNREKILGKYWEEQK